MKADKILLGHGSGGKLSHDLISDLFIKYFENPVLNKQTDSALLDMGDQKISFTTDSFVVDPIFFPGGNIGKLAIAGTVNDLAVSGATPKFISCGFIIEEGLPFSELEKIVETMAVEAEKAGVAIVTGDTKVVDKGKCDKIFINTSGIGSLTDTNAHIGSGDKVIAGDKIIINGSIGDHGMAIMAKRNDLNLHTDIQSDCACLNHMVREVLDAGMQVKFMRDATRGGLSTVLCELAENKNLGVEIDELSLPVKDNVRGICELLGFDPIYVANEGKIVMIVDASDAERTVELLKQNEFGQEAAIIGTVVNQHHGKGWLTTGIGGKRIIDMLAGEQLPRIC